MNIRLCHALTFVFKDGMNLLLTPLALVSTDLSNNQTFLSINHPTDDLA